MSLKKAPVLLCVFFIASVSLGTVVTYYYLNDRMNLREEAISIRNDDLSFIAGRLSKQNKDIQVMFDNVKNFEAHIRDYCDEQDNAPKCLNSFNYKVR